MKKVPLYHFDIIVGYALVDDRDYKYVMQWKWHPCCGYPYTKDKGRSVYLHRKVLRNCKAPRIDHRDGNRMDNRRKNLRPCTVAQNAANSKKYNGKKSQYKGVGICSRTGKFIARLMLDQKEIHIGRYLSEIDAAIAYNVAAKKYFGKFARLNVI